jgi:DNA transposition AAA+ family ATPase
MIGGDDSPNRPGDEQLALSARIGAARMLEDSRPLTPELRDQVIATVRAFMARKKLSLARVAHSLDCSEALLSAVLAGKYGADSEKHVRALDNWLEGELLRESAPKPRGFVLTGIAKRIYQLATYARTHNTITLGYGPAGIGRRSRCKRFTPKCRRAFTSQ